MAYEANETIWTPGRTNSGNEIETDVQAAFTALADVRTTDLAVRAALGPWNFVSGASVGAPVWQSSVLTVPDAPSAIFVGGQLDTGYLRLRVTEMWGAVSPASGDTIGFTFISEDEDGTTTNIGTVIVGPADTFAVATPAGAPVPIPVAFDWTHLATMLV